MQFDKTGRNLMKLKLVSRLILPNSGFVFAKTSPSPILIPVDPPHFFTHNHTLYVFHPKFHSTPVFFVQRLRIKRWTYMSKFCLFYCFSFCIQFLGFALVKEPVLLQYNLTLFVTPCWCQRHGWAVPHSDILTWLNSTTLGIFSLAEPCHTQVF